MQLEKGFFLEFILNITQTMVTTTRDNNNKYATTRR